MTDIMPKLIEKSISIDDLLLDPNNPRFVRDFNFTGFISDGQTITKQSEILSAFGNGSGEDEENVTDISVLYKSMVAIGFVPIDRIVVRKINNCDQYIVIEGNRRISTIKKILQDYENHENKFDKHDARKKLEPLMTTFKKITCMVLNTEGLTAEDISHKISIILGLRHHGSLLEWKPLPKAFNIYKVYMEIEPRSEEFIFVVKKANDVASRLSISRGDVKDVLKTYLVYLQLSENYDARASHYSLIEEGVTNKHLSELIKVDESAFRMDEASLERMNQVCQFSTRDSLGPDDKKIIRDPKAFGRLGKLYQMKKNATHEAIKSYASELINRVIDEEDALDLDAALDDLTDFKNKTQWVEAVAKLLDKQESELSLDDYAGEGNDLGNKDALKQLLEKFRRMAGI